MKAPNNDVNADLLTHAEVIVHEIIHKSCWTLSNMFVEFSPASKKGLNLAIIEVLCEILTKCDQLFKVGSTYLNSIVNEACFALANLVTDAGRDQLFALI